MLKEFINRIGSFINSNPQRAKLIGLLFLLLSVPLTIAATLTVQNLIQHASESAGVQIIDDKGNPITSTYSTHVLLKVTLPANWVALSSQPQGNNIRSVVKNAYAANTESSGNTDTSSNTIYNQCLQDCAVNGQSNCTQVCASILTPVPTATPTNTPTPIPTTSMPSCSQRPNCETCVLSFNGVRCGWNGFYCETGSGNNTCPLLNQKKYDQWYWGTCSTNLCATSSTQTPTPTTLSKPEVTLSLSCKDNSHVNWAVNISGVNEPGDLKVFEAHNGNIRKLQNNAGYSGSYVGSIDNNSNGQYSVTLTKPGTSQPLADPVTKSIDCSNYIPKIVAPVNAEILKGVSIENKDNDGSGGGSDLYNVNSGLDNLIASSIPWTLNELLPSQNQATRVVQVTLLGDRGDSVPFTAIVTLVRPGTSTSLITPPSSFTVPTGTTTSKPEIQLTLSCQSKSQVGWHIKTIGVTSPANLDLFVNGNPEFSLKGQGGNANVGNLPNEPGANGNYIVTLKDPSTNKLIASATKEIDCLSFNPQTTSSSSVSTVNLALSCIDSQTVKWSITVGGSSGHVNLDLFRNGNSKYHSSDLPSSFATSGTGLNGDYDLRISDPTSGKNLATKEQNKDCTRYNLLYDLTTEKGEIDGADAEILTSQYGKKGANLSADLNHDGVVDGLDYNLLLSHFTVARPFIFNPSIVPTLPQ